MSNVIPLFHGRVKAGKALPKPVECKDCGEDVETARLQVMPLAIRCVSCERAREKRFNRQMEAVREHQSVQIIR
jgi:hypothetical protein